MSLTSAAIRNNRVTLVVIFLVLAGGLLAYQNASRAEDPGFPIRTAMIQTIFPGASPTRVELLVTDKLEKSIQQMPELDNVTSISKTGVSTIFVNIKEIHKEHELRRIWDSLRRKVDAARGDLPQGVIGPMVNDEFGDVFGTVIGLTGDGYTYAELKQVADEVRDQLLHLDDAAKVEIFGAQEERVFIEFRNERLSELGLSPGQLQQLLASQNIVTPGGRVRVGEERYALEPSGNFESVNDIETALIQLPGRRDVIPLSDIAKVKRGYIDPARFLFHDTGTPGLALAMSMRKGGDIIELGEQTKKLIRELEERYPIGLQFNVLVYQPKDVIKMVGDFTGNLLQAIFVVMGAMVLFLGIRTGLIVASLIPTAIAAALLVMGIFGIGLDQMSLASLIIALGMLVDNAVVMAESTMTQVAGGKTRVQAAIDSAKELQVPLLVASLTTCAAFLPMFLAESSTGEYVAPLFKVVTITLLCSWLLALTLTPLLCASFLKVKSDPEAGAYGSRFYRAYNGVLVLGLKNRVVSMVIVVVVFFLGMQSFKYLPNIFFPPSDNPSFIVKLEMPAGTAVEETTRRIDKLEQFMRRELLVNESRTEGAQHWATFIGEGGPRFYLSYNPEPPTPEFGVLIVSTTTRQAAEEGVQKVRRFIAENLPDARATVEPRALGPPAVAPVLFEVSGKEPDEVFAIVDRLKAKLESIKGTTNVRDNWGQRVKKLQVEIDHARARRAGLSNQDIAVSLQTALSGFEITQYREQDEIIPVVLRSDEADRGDIGKLETLSVFAQATGRAVPLKAVADVSVVWEPSKIRRKDRYKTVSVLANLDGSTTAAEVNQAVVPWLKRESKGWDVGYRWELGGEMKEAEKGNKSINDKMPIAMFIITLLLVFQFNSIRRPLIILLTIPLAVVGVGLGLLLFRSYFGFMTLLGVISLFGIVINNAIVLIDRIKIEIDENGHPPPRAIVEASQRRLRPILLTTFTTILGLFPLWFGGGPMWEPMAIAIICGLAFSTMLTLGVVPILYSLLFKVSFKGFELPREAKSSADV